MPCKAELVYGTGIRMILRGERESVGWGLWGRETLIGKLSHLRGCGVGRGKERATGCALAFTRPSTCKAYFGGLGVLGALPGDGVDRVDSAVMESFHRKDVSDGKERGRGAVRRGAASEGRFREGQPWCPGHRRPRSSLATPRAGLRSGTRR